MLMTNTQSSSTRKRVNLHEKEFSIKTLHQETPVFARPLEILILSLASFFVALPSFADELITLATRPGVTQSLLLWEPHSQNPDTVVLLLPGGSGNVGLGMKDGRAEAARPHIFSRQREVFPQPQFAIVVVDAPSDVKDMSQEFRLSDRHSADMAAVLLEIRTRFPNSKIAVLGHSRGTVSAGYISRRMGERIGALILFSGVYRASKLDPLIPSSGPGLSELDLGSLKAPTLIIHNTKDACPAAPFKAAEELSGRPAMIAVNGGDEANTGSPCGPGTNHWFVGMERVVGGEVVNWLLGKAWSQTVP